MDRQPGIPDSVATRSDDVALVVFDSAAPPLPPIPPSGDKGTLKLAYKTLGVVFGGLVTSPLYVYPSMRLKSPTEDDYLGIYSIMFWTLSLIGVVKYACIALRADDQGEGGTFALYSLLCRNLDIGILSSKHVALNSSSEKRSRLGIFFEKSVVARRVLLFIAMLGMCMLIGDGVLTPAISVLSAIDGIRAPFPSVSKTLVEVMSAVVLIALFLLQKYGTSRVSFIFSPIMGTWTVTTPLIGIYSIIRHYPSIFKAISPHYIVSFFLRNGKEGWVLLGGTVLCITGSEALFADLGHFNRKSIQLAFLFTIYPSLVLTYAGQTAYLIKNPNDHDDGFYKFIPKTIYWPMFIIATLAAIVASQSLISATFSIIKQSVTLDYFPRVKVVHTSSKKEGEVYCPEINYILMILCVVVILIFGDGKDIGNAFGVVVSLVMLITTILLTFVMIMIWRTPPVLVALYFIVYFVMEGVYVSAVSTKIPQGGWIPYAISFVLAFIMFGWFNGRHRKIQYEQSHKIDRDRLRMLLSDPIVQRVPGVCFFYTSIQDGLTPILGHYIKNMKSLHKVTIFTTFRYLLVPRVAPHERIVVSKLGLKGVYRCVVQYGYADSLDLEGDDFVSQVIDRLRAHINGSDYATSVTSELEEEMSDMEEAKLTGAVHVRGKTRFYVSKNCGWFDGYMLAFYEVLHRNCRSALPALGVPLSQRVEVGMLYEVRERGGEREECKSQGIRRKLNQFQSGKQTEDPNQLGLCQLILESAGSVLLLEVSPTGLDHFGSGGSPSTWNGPKGFCFNQWVYKLPWTA
ncbi:putative potassium transporter 17 [Camellia lanceoleosa]|uniref:Potassium transporter 17 n=1 Tax=Camellia lanceoleosa TaxID=1840588 RepID=A0ACC0FYZ6_9ERIC|nr:putative potassium transporter 17 [Camellia lanceoleosa]